MRTAHCALRTAAPGVGAAGARRRAGPVSDVPPPKPARAVRVIPIIMPRYSYHHAYAWDIEDADTAELDEDHEDAEARGDAEREELAGRLSKAAEGCRGQMKSRELLKMVKVRKPVQVPKAVVDREGKGGCARPTKVQEKPSTQDASDPKRLAHGRRGRRQSTSEQPGMSGEMQKVAVDVEGAEGAECVEDVEDDAYLDRFPPRETISIEFIEIALLSR
eukprot:gene16770-biopygen8459